jgi:hypothetical protein
MKRQHKQMWDGFHGTKAPADAGIAFKPTPLATGTATDPGGPLTLPNGHSSVVKGAGCQRTWTPADDSPASKSPGIGKTSFNPADGVHHSNIGIPVQGKGQTDFECGNHKTPQNGMVGSLGSISHDTAGKAANFSGTGSTPSTDFAKHAPTTTHQAPAPSPATTHAEQTSTIYLDQSATQIAGKGGSGGNGNMAMGGDVSIGGHAQDAQGSVHGGIGAGLIATGGNAAGNGGNGYFMGDIINSPTTIFHPINVAVGAGGTANAHQMNTAHIDQSSVQIAGVGGDGGNGNTAIGGNVSISGLGQGIGHGWIGSDAIATGHNEAGNGGDGIFAGNMAHVSFVLYEPINIAVAGPGSTAEADQANSVDFNQSAVQIAGVGGHGGNGNVAAGGNVAMKSFGSGSIGSDVIATGGNEAGNGGSGHFTGSMTDVSVAIYAPVNIAVAGYNSTAFADQNNNVHFDQSAIQIAGIGGTGGDSNHALGGDLALQLLQHLPIHL